MRRFCFLLGAGFALAACSEGDADDLLQLREGSLSGAPADAHGKFGTRIWDMLDGTTRVTHHLMDWDARADTEVVLPDGLVIERDAIVDVWGERDETGALVIDSLEVVERPPQALIDPDARPPRRIATILVQWNGAGLPNGEANGLMYTSEASTNVFYAENSYGIETMSGDVFGPYEVGDPGGCNTSLIQFYGMDAFEAHGHNPNNYEQFMFHFPGTGGCGFSGLAGLGQPDKPAGASWYNGSFGCVVRNQELGHNYGMGHSHGQVCRDENGDAVPLSENCTHIEYGDPFDPMGGGCAHINAAQKVYMGWLDECNVVRATSDATFNLLPLEVPCDGPQALRFPSFRTGRDYWLEYRTPVGHFDSFEGVVVHHVADFEEPTAPSPYYVDVETGPYLTEGESFTDPDGVVTFTVLEFHGTHAVIEATFGESSGDAPTCLDGSDPGNEGGHVGQRICADAPYDGDMAPPEITLTFPEDEAWFAPGSDFKIMADVTDDRGIIDVELYLDGERLFRITEPPWEWEVTNIPEGRYEFGAIARDSRHATPSNAVDVRVDDDPPSDDESGGESGGESSGGVDPTATTGDTMDDAMDDAEGTGSGSAGEAANDGGCGCRSSGAPAPLALLLLAFGLRRRRR